MGVVDAATREARLVRRTFEGVVGGALLFVSVPVLIFTVRDLAKVAWVMVGQGGLPRGVDSTQATVLACFLAIAIFFAQVGFRLVSHRPNVHGSLLSPGGWATLAFVFLGVGVALSIAVTRGGGPFPIVLDLGMLAFAGVCLGVARRVDRRSAARGADRSKG